MKTTNIVNRGKAALFALGLSAGAMLATSAVAHDGDHWPIAGDQLKMTYSDNGSKTKFQFKAKKQVNLNGVSLGEDPTTEGATLIVRGSGTSTGVIQLDPERWSRIGSESKPRGWKFKGSPYYTSGITKIQVKSSKNGGSLQIQAKGFYWPFDLTDSQDSIEIMLTIGEYGYCAAYAVEEMTTNEAGEIKGQLSASPTGCPQVCGNGITEIGEECDDGNFEDSDTCTNECLGCNPSSAEYASTYEGIQDLIFDNPVYNCSNDTCHGASVQSGGLDLRSGLSHSNLVNVASSIAPGTKRVFPGDQDLSLLYNKIAEKTLGTPDAPGTSMPAGTSAVVTGELLEALRLWIRGGASETGVVAGTAELLGSCLPPATPLDIPQPPIPDPAEGAQFPMPGYNLASQSEVEGCVASYYDVSATVPANMMVDCPGVFPGTNETGLNAGKCLSYRGNALFQDAQSHHSIIHIYQGAYDWDDSGWGGWKCYGGPTPNAACSPETANACGNGGVCGSGFHFGVACIGDWGPPDFGNVNVIAPQFAGSQESTADQNYPEGVFSVLPLKGLIVWNSHAFNLTGTDAEMNAWLNMGYTDVRTWPAQGIFAAQNIFTQDVPPFEQREYCATYTFPDNSQLFQLSSHTHKRGVRWRYYQAPQTPCTSVGPGGSQANPACTPGSPGDIFYESYDYSDALTINYDTPVTYAGTVNDRTIKYCALYDNGFEDPLTVKTQSGSPTPTGNLPIGGPCADSLTACMGGVNKGALCNGIDANCPGSTCDACPLRGGVTTEDEMFLALGNYYID